MTLPPKIFSERAPAKINLTLHIEGRRADGYHELQSLVAFAGACDRLTLTPDATFSLTLAGDSAGAAGPDNDNLVARAEKNLRALKPDMKTGHFHLTKNLPVAAGVGGGSSDAAAALRALARLNGFAPDDPDLFAAARATGADVPVCLDPRGRMMAGIGEKLGATLELPALFAVLVNPRQPVETRQVFARMRLTPGQSGGFGPHPVVAPTPSREALLGALKKGRNDMEDAAASLAPVIVHALAVLSAAPGCQLARMSGSGATCFAVFGSCRQAARAARSIKRDHPEWWVKPTVLR